MYENNNNSGNRTKTVGVAFSELLFLVFLVLKLTNVIDWSWWWVTAPLWISFGLAIIIIVIFVLIHVRDAVDYDDT